MRTTLLQSLIVAASPRCPLVAQQPYRRDGGSRTRRPAAGEMAPDLPWPAASKDGIASEPITLSKLRGKVVVLGLLSRRSDIGCTAEMTKFRDDYVQAVRPTASSSCRSPRTHSDRMPFGPRT